MHSQKQMYLKLIFIHIVFLTNGDAMTDTSESLSINNISDALVTLLNTEGNVRINELRDKLDTINKYVIDKDKFSTFLLNVTKETNLNETNFYKSLNESDHFKFLIEQEPKNLYLKLKEKMNRDDIMKILVERGDSKIAGSARKAMGKDYFAEDRDLVFDEEIDKMIAESPTDNHKFERRMSDSKYWDPQNELDELRDYHRHDGRRIYRGERTTIRYYPFMASVHVMGRFWCGGVLYWHDLVLTSASCLQLMHNNRFFRENPKVLQVRIGSNHSRIGGENIEALEVYFHPSYSPKTLKNNIAVIRLRRHIAFTYHRLPKIIDISHNSDGLPATAEVLLLGWGVTKMSQKMSYEPIFLQRKFLPVYPNTFCKEVYGKKFITQTMFCAGTLTTGEGACDHDAGGPAILSGKLVGIISFGPAICGYPNAPTVFTLVGAYADWIETINETMPEYYRGKKRTTTTEANDLAEILKSWTHQTTAKAAIEPVPLQSTDFTTPPAPVTLETTPMLLRMREADGWSDDRK